jgi:hypothetical protein
LKIASCLGGLNLTFLLIFFRNFKLHDGQFEKRFSIFYDKLFKFFLQTKFILQFLF